MVRCLLAGPSILGRNGRISYPGQALRAVEYVFTATQENRSLPQPNPKLVLHDGLQRKDSNCEQRAVSRIMVTCPLVHFFSLEPFF